MDGVLKSITDPINKALAPLYDLINKAFEYNKFLAGGALATFITVALFFLMVALISLGETGIKTDKSRKLADVIMPERDIDTLFDFIEEKSIKFDDLFKVKNGQHPPLVKIYLANKITIETMIILNDILNYTKQFNKEISETVIWTKKYKLLMNYKPFLKYNITKMKMIIKKKING